MREILELAEENQMGVFFGIPQVEIAWMLQPPKVLDNLLETHSGVIDEISNFYDEFSSFKGWYLPYELCNGFMQLGNNNSLLPEWLNSIARLCKEFSKNKKISIAPYFTNTLDNGKFEALWRNAFSLLSNIDIIMMQDSAGIFKEERLKELAHYFSIFKKIANEYKKELWADVEVFDQASGIPHDFEKWSAAPARYHRLSRQLEITSQFVNKIVIFSFCEYMSPEASANAQSLYQDYVKGHLESSK